MDAIEIVDIPKEEVEIPPKERIYYQFNHPSSRELEQLCKKFSVEYSHEAYSTWAKINVQKFSSYSPTIKTNNSPSRAIHEPLCLLLTGDDFYVDDTRTKLKDAYVQHLIESGSAPDLESATNRYYIERANFAFNEFVATFLGCRIGVYKGKHLERFGQDLWNQDDPNILTFLFSFDVETDRYDIVTFVRTW